MTCRATTKKGNPCGARAHDDRGICVFHLASQGDPEARALQRRARGAAETQLEVGKANKKHAAVWRKLATYRDDVARFAAEVLHTTLWAHQVRFAEAVKVHRRTAWRTPVACGKTHTGAVVALHFLLTQSDAIVVVVGANANQLRNVLWRTIRQLAKRAKLLRELDQPGEVPGIGWRPAGDRLLVGVAADAPEAFAGVHAPNVLILVDEGSALARERYDALLGNTTGAGGRIALIGNPLRCDGPFYDAFHKKADLFCRLHTTWQDVPADIPGLIDENFVRELEADYGPNSPPVLIRCYGEFAVDVSDGVIAYSLVADARARHDAGPQHEGEVTDYLGGLVLGVDPSYKGDDEAVIVPRRGLVVYKPIAYRNVDGPALAARVQEVADRMRVDGEVVRVNVDAIGVGVSVFDQLMQSGRGLDVHGINVGEAATVETYERLRDQVWFAARDWLKGGGMLPDDDKLVAELTAPTYSFSVRQRLKVESKDDLRKRLKRSPDRADALCLAVFEQPGERDGIDGWADVEEESLEEFCKAWSPMGTTW